MVEAFCSLLKIRVVHIFKIRMVHNFKKLGWLTFSKKRDLNAIFVVALEPNQSEKGKKIESPFYFQLILVLLSKGGFRFLSSLNLSWLHFFVSPTLVAVQK